MNNQEFTKFLQGLNNNRLKAYYRKYRGQFNNSTQNLQFIQNCSGDVINNPEQDMKEAKEQFQILKNELGQRGHIA